MLNMEEERIPNQFTPSEHGLESAFPGIRPNKHNEGEDDESEYVLRKEEEEPFKAKRQRRTSPFTVHIHNVSKDPTKVRLPRIIPKDIRRKYAGMFINILNSMDMTVIAPFFQEFTHAETILRRQYWSSRKPRRELQSFAYYGLLQILGYLHIWCLLTPDFIIEMKGDVSIITRSDSFRSEISFEFKHLCHLFYSASSPSPCPFVVNYFEKDSSPFQQQEREMLHLEKALNRLKESEEHPSEDFVRRVELLKQKQVEIREKSFEDLRNHFETEFEILNPPVPLEFIGKIILIINNVYEQEQLDEIIIQSYGFVEPISRNT